MDAPGVAGDVDVRLARVSGDGDVVEVVRDVVGGGVRFEGPGLDVVLADGAGGADEPQSSPVVGDVGAVEVVPVPGRTAVDDLPPAVGGAFDDDAGAADGDGVRGGGLDVVERDVDGALGRLPRAGVGELPLRLS